MEWVSVGGVNGTERERVMGHMSERQGATTMWPICCLEAVGLMKTRSQSGSWSLRQARERRPDRFVLGVAALSGVDLAFAHEHTTGCHWDHISYVLYNLYLFFCLPPRSFISTLFFFSFVLRKGEKGGGERRRSKIWVSMLWAGNHRLRGDAAQHV